MHVFDLLIEELETVKAAAALKNASFGFPNDRLEIKSIHYSRDWHVGDMPHPTEYIRKMTDLHHKTWIINPIDKVIDLLKLHAETFRKSEKLVRLLKEAIRQAEEDNGENEV